MARTMMCTPDFVRARDRDARACPRWPLPRLRLQRVCVRWQHRAVAALRRHTEKCGGDVPPQAKLWRFHAATASNHVAAWDRHSPAMQRWQTARVYIVAAKNRHSCVLALA